MAVDVLLGMQWGDEGKGKIVDCLGENYEVIARFQGGPNAGHTLVINGQKTVLHTIPSGVFRKDVINFIGNGVVIDPVTFRKEVEQLLAIGVDIKDNLYISEKAHLILPTHKMIDAASEKAKGKNKIGSTLRGIGPTYMDKTGRNGLRIGDTITTKFQEKYSALKNKHYGILKSYNYECDVTELEKEWFDAIEFVKQFQLVNGEYFINQCIKDGKKILAEGAQGSLLDIDFGTYPFVTSSNTIASGACIGLGVAPRQMQEVIGISKAYCTRVGSGPFPTELFGEEGEFLRKEGSEFGATTGRPRRCGWIDLPALKYAIMVSGVSQIVLTKIDVLNKFETIKVCTHYEINGEIVDQLPYDLDASEITPIYKTIKGWQQDINESTSYENLPQDLKNYIVYLEEELNVPISIISVGPGREQIILKAVEATV